MKGTVGRIVASDGGYGWIAGADGRRYFFARRALKNCRLEALERGREVTFEESDGPHGPKADDVFVDDVYGPDSDD